MIWKMVNIKTKTSALTPDGGLINGVGALSQGKHLTVGASTLKRIRDIDFQLCDNICSRLYCQTFGVCHRQLGYIY